MVAPSTQTLLRIADDTGHQLGTLEKVLKPLDLLQEIARDQVLSEVSTGSRSISTGTT